MSLMEMLSEFCLRAISDDYENFAKVLTDVASWTKERGVKANSESILSALEALISDGYAQAYILSSDPPGNAKAVSYSRDRLEELWFYLTPNGKQLAIQFREKWRE
jgi:hypothetical protein